MKYYAICLSILLLCYCPLVLADQTDQGNVTITNLSEPQAQEQFNLPYYPEVLHIQNGDCVPLNATVDVSSIGWGVPSIAYYGQWVDDYYPGNRTPKYQLEMPNTASKLKHFWINPALFGNATGFWYQRYDNGDIEIAGNLRYFRVNLTCPPPQEDIQQYVVNVTAVNKTEPVTKPFLPEKRESDILIARGDSVSLSEETPLHWWLFGYSAYGYVADKASTHDVLTLNSTDFNGLETGNYYLDIVRPGNNSLLEENYNPQYKAERFVSPEPVIESPIRTTNPIYITDLDSMGVRDALHKMVSKSIDDSYTELRLQYQDPNIQIMRIDALKNPDNDTWYNIRGYTNLANNTILTITIDAPALTQKDKNKPTSSWNTSVVAVSDDPGVWREFNALIPVDYKKIYPGQHWVTVSYKNTAKTTVGVYIYKELPPHYVPPEYIEYVGVSPYITPQVINRTVIVEVTHEVIKVVTQQITPSQADWDNYVAAEQRVWIGEAITVGIILAIILGGAYLGYVVLRSRRKD